MISTASQQNQDTLFAVNKQNIFAQCIRFDQFVFNKSPVTKDFVTTDVFNTTPTSKQTNIRNYTEIATDC
jgi:hypothetical protein